MPQFAILLHAPTPGDWESAPEEELEAHGAFAEDITAKGGEIVAAYALHPSTSGKNLTGKDVTVKDGAYGGGEDVLGGITIVEAEDLDHAVDIASTCPATWRSGVEVRPLIEVPEEG